MFLGAGTTSLFLRILLPLLLPGMLAALLLVLVRTIAMFELPHRRADHADPRRVALLCRLCFRRAGWPVDRCHGGRLYGDDAVLAGDRAAEVRQPDADRRSGQSSSPRTERECVSARAAVPIFLLTENLLGRAVFLTIGRWLPSIVGVTVISLRNLIMAQYKETNRFHCESSSGAHYVVIEQILTSRLALDVGESPRTDYGTDIGEIAERFDDISSFCFVGGSPASLPEAARSRSRLEISAGWLSNLTDCSGRSRERSGTPWPTKTRNPICPPPACKAGN